MLREALVCASALTLLGGCDRPEWEQESPPPDPVVTPAPPKLVHPLGDLMPLVIHLDCSELGDRERPASVYVTIRTPQAFPSGQALVARVDSDTLCETHDLAENPAAPALALRCPPRQIMEYDTGRHDCTHHDIEINVCSPGFVSYADHWTDFSSCGGDGLEQPSCASLNAGDATSYGYAPVVYKLTPKPEGAGASCGDAPTTLLADDTTFECPCFEQ
jgi:hypothetical protein